MPIVERQDRRKTVPPLSGSVLNVPDVAGRAFQESPFVGSFSRGVGLPWSPLTLAELFSALPTVSDVDCGAGVGEGVIK